MNSTITLFTTQHQHIQELLPWYINQSLTADESLQVASHLRNCSRCRHEYEQLGKLADAVGHSADLSMAAELSFAGLRSKIQRRPANRRRPISALLKPLTIAASVLLAVLPLFYALQPLLSEDYYTLAAKPVAMPAARYLHIVFAKSAGSADINALIAAVQAQQVAGPNSVGAYTLQMDGGKDSHALSEAIAYLRRQPLVMLVEPAIQP